MRKILLIFIMLIALPCCAETFLTGGINYNVDSARQELFNSPVKKLNPELVAQYLSDKNYNENIGYILQGNVNLQDRTLAFFSDSTYAILYNDDKYHVWYYGKDGKLIYMEERDGLNYPYKSYKYTNAGVLVNMGLRVSKEETFIYNPQGKLIAHWLGTNAYDETGNVVMTRKYIH